MSSEVGRTSLLLLGEIAAEAAHELRNALAVISGSASVMRTADPAQREAHLAKIERNARLAQNVVDALFALARGEAVRGEPVVIADAIAEARRDVTGAVEYIDDVGATSIRGSIVLLARMFRVIYDNAIQAGAKRITTHATSSAGVLTIEIRDDGPGIPDAIHETLFEPLVTTKKDGTGLGLALARRVAKAHDGDIALGPAPGACFLITMRS